MKIFAFASLFAILLSQSASASFSCSRFPDGTTIWVDSWVGPASLQGRAECECNSNRAKRISKISAHRGEYDSVTTYTARFLCIPGPGHRTSPIDSI